MSNNDYDKSLDSDLQEIKKSAEKRKAENKKLAEEIMKKGKMAPEPEDPEDPEQDKPKIKLRCGSSGLKLRGCGGSRGYKKGGLVTKGKPKIAKKGWR